MPKLGHESREAGSVRPDVLAPDGRSQEAGVLGSLRVQRRPEVCLSAGRDAAVEIVCRDVCAARSIRTPRRSRASAAGLDGGTIYLTTADRWGNMVSLIHSVFSVYGSRATVAPYGFVLHNRGSAFSLDPTKPECRRAAEAPVPHDHRRLRDEGRPAAHDVRQHGRQRAAGNARAAHRQSDRSRHERADDDRRGEVYAQPDIRTCCRWRRTSSIASAPR